MDTGTPRWTSPGAGWGIVPLTLGAILALTYVWRFGTTGEGTPAPFDPPRKFVAVGPYRYVRNPMYIGMALALIGEAVLFAERTSLMRTVWYGLALVAITNAFVFFYEEPALRRRYGAEHEEYCRRVRGWWPAVPRHVA